MLTKIKKETRKSGFYVLSINLMALFFVIPQFLTKGMIIGSDIIFHFNRFYDVSQQIEHQNFQYFINQYGFQQSGRIVNALYGPLMAYFHGFLVWLSPSWFAYQILANFILFAIAGNCMYFLLKACKVEKRKSFYFSIIYMTSFSIIYWVSRQGFTSWGAAVLPICLLPIVDLFEEKRFPPLKVGFLMALMFQIHVFSSILLLIIYLVFFIYVFIADKEKRKPLFLQGFLSVCLFFALTLNVWYGFLTLYQGNELLAPFINRSMYKNTITLRSSYWLVTPSFLLLFVFFYFWKSRKDWKKLSAFDQVVAGVGLFFFVLSTNLIPWRLLTKQNWTVIETIQFPFRFFVPFTVLLIIFVSRNGQLLIKKKDWTMRFLQIAVVFAVLQVSVTTLSQYHLWQTSDKGIKKGRHTHLYSEDMAEIKDSFFKRDKSEALTYIQKATPDYLPIYEDNKLNKYEQYKKWVIDPNESGKFTKTVENNRLVVTWNGEGEEIPIPVIVYHETLVSFNQKELVKEDLKLSSIGTPILVSKKGMNHLEISYQTSKVLMLSIVIPIITLIALAGKLLYTKIKR